MTSRWSSSTTRADPHAHLTPGRPGPMRGSGRPGVGVRSPWSNPTCSESAGYWLHRLRRAPGRPVGHTTPSTRPAPGPRAAVPGHTSNRMRTPCAHPRSAAAGWTTSPRTSTRSGPRSPWCLPSPPSCSPWRAWCPSSPTSWARRRRPGPGRPRCRSASAPTTSTTSASRRVMAPSSR